MSAHLAYPYRTGGGPWRVSCPDEGCNHDEPAMSQDHADFLADEHHRTASCTCWRSDLLEWWPDGCNLPVHREAAAP